VFYVFYVSAARARQGTGRPKAGTKRTRRGQEEGSSDSEQEAQQDDATEGMADMCLSDGEAPQETDMEADAGPVMLPSSGRSQPHHGVDICGNTKLSTNGYIIILNIHIYYICVYI
jgi:hypothetical protein